MPVSEPGQVVELTGYPDAEYFRFLIFLALRALREIWLWLCSQITGLCFIFYPVFLR